MPNRMATFLASSPSIIAKLTLFLRPSLKATATEVNHEGGSPAFAAVVPPPSSSLFAGSAAVGLRSSTLGSASYECKKAWTELVLPA